MGDGAPATLAHISSPFNVTADNNGNVYIPDNGYNRIRKVNSSGIISTIAGTGAGGYNGDNIAATTAEINSPYSVRLDKWGNIYISDFHNSRIRRIDTSGIISTIAGTGTPGYSGDNGPATSARIEYPLGIAVDTSGNLYVADGNNVIRKINSSGTITTFAGNGYWGSGGDGGHATRAEFHFAVDVAVDDSGNVYIADDFNNKIRKVDKSGIISTIAGNGTTGFSGDGGLAISGVLNQPGGVAADKYGQIYIADGGNNRVRAIVSPLSVGKDFSNAFGLEIYPNPNTGFFTINIKGSTVATAIVSVHNVLGEKISEVKVATNKPTDLTIDLPGIYFLSTAIGDQTFHKEVIVNK